MRKDRFQPLFVSEAEGRKSLGGFSEFCEHALLSTVIVGEQEYATLANIKGFPELAYGPAFCLARYNLNGIVSDLTIAINRDFYRVEIEDHSSDYRDLIPYILIHEMSEVYFKYQSAIKNWNTFVNRAHGQEEMAEHFEAERMEYIAADLDNQMNRMSEFHRTMRERELEKIKQQHVLQPWFNLQLTLDYERKKMATTERLVKDIVTYGVSPKEQQLVRPILQLVHQWWGGIST